ncbi:hypothetical protein ACWCPI_36735 [Streptomyces sp. NPDC001920]
MEADYRDRSNKSPIFSGLMPCRHRKPWPADLTVGKTRRMSATPNLDEVAAELALDRALRWIDRPRDTSAWLWIGGRAGSGRTALLRAVVARHPAAAHVDCAGRSAEEVARELAKALGIAAPDSFDDNFGSAARRIKGDPVVVLTNTQWAGRLRTSREPERVIDRVARALITFRPRGLRMRLLVEVDDAPGRADELGGRHLTLQGGFESMPAFAEQAEDAALTSALDALALAEHRFVPLPVWSMLCSALGQDVPESRLESLLGEPMAGDWLRRTGDGTGTPLISFQQEAAARRLRTQMPAEEARSWHARAVTALSAADASEATRWYAERALAGHAGRSRCGSRPVRGIPQRRGSSRRVRPRDALRGVRGRVPWTADPAGMCRGPPPLPGAPRRSAVVPR